MFEDWKAKLFPVIAVVAIVAALLFGRQTWELKVELATARTELRSCQQSSQSLQVEVERLTKQLNASLTDYEALRNEYDQLKARRGGTRKTVQTR